MEDYPKDSVCQVFCHKHEKYVVLHALKAMEFEGFSDGIVTLMRNEHSYDLIDGEIMDIERRDVPPFPELMQDIPAFWISKKRNASMNIRLYSLEYTWFKELALKQGFLSVSTYVLTVIHVRLGYFTHPSGFIEKKRDCSIALGEITYGSAFKYIAGLNSKNAWRYMSVEQMKIAGLIDENGRYLDWVS